LELVNDSKFKPGAKVRWKTTAPSAHKGRTTVVLTSEQIATEGLQDLMSKGLVAVKSPASGASFIDPEEWFELVEDVVENKTAEAKTKDYRRCWMCGGSNFEIFTDYNDNKVKKGHRMGCKTGSCGSPVA